MVSDIVPLLAACTGLEQSEADAEFASAWDEAKSASTGQPNSLTFVEAVSLFRATHPFPLEELQMAWKAKQEIDSRGAVWHGNTLPPPR